MSQNPNRKFSYFRECITATPPCRSPSSGSVQPIVLHRLSAPLRCGEIIWSFGDTGISGRKSTRPEWPPWANTSSVSLSYSQCSTAHFAPLQSKWVLIYSLAEERTNSWPGSQSERVAGDLEHHQLSNPQPAWSFSWLQVVSRRVTWDRTDAHSQARRCSRCLSLAAQQHSASVNRASAWSRLVKSEDVHQLQTGGGMLTVCEPC